MATAWNGYSGFSLNVNNSSWTNWNVSRADRLEQKVKSSFHYWNRFSFQSFTGVSIFTWIIEKKKILLETILAFLSTFSSSDSSSSSSSFHKWQRFHLKWILLETFSEWLKAGGKNESEMLISDLRDVREFRLSGNPLPAQSRIRAGDIRYILAVHEAYD